MVAAFLVVLTVAELGARAVGALLPEPRRWYHDIAQVKVEQLDAMRGAHLDIVFAGTSQTYYGVDPSIVDRTLGTTSYNAAIPAGVPPIQERWLLEEILRRVEPAIVAWGLSPLDLNDGRDLSVVSAYDEAVATRRGLQANLERRLADWFALVRRRRQLRDPEVWADVRAGKRPIAATRSLLLPNGHRPPADGTPTDAERRRLRNQVVGDYRLDGEMADSVRGTVETVRARGTDVVLLWLPVPDRLVGLLDDPNVVAEARQLAQDVADELSVELLDVSQEFTDDDFSDYTHLGPGGARKLSRQLAHQLSRQSAAPG